MSVPLIRSIWRDIAVPTLHGTSSSCSWHFKKRLHDAVAACMVTVTEPGHSAIVTGHGAIVTGHGAMVTGHGAEAGHGAVTGHGAMVTVTDPGYHLSMLKA